MDDKQLKYKVKAGKQGRKSEKRIQEPGTIKLYRRKSVKIKKNFSPKNGFTFIELAVVLAILAMLSSLTVIWLGNFIAARSVYTDAMNMCSMARLAGEMAGSKGVNVRFCFDASNKMYWLAPFNLDGFYAEDASAKKNTLFEKTLVKQFVTPRNSLTEGYSGSAAADTIVDYVTFYPDGSSENARIVLADEKSNIYTVYFAQTTGSVKVYPYEIIY